MIYQVTYCNINYNYYDYQARNQIYKAIKKTLETTDDTFVFVYSKAQLECPDVLKEKGLCPFMVAHHMGSTNKNYMDDPKRLNTIILKGKKNG